MRNDGHNSGEEHRRSLRPIVARAVWFCLLLLLVGAMLAFATLESFPRPGASEPLGGVAALQESCGIAIMRVTHYPFYWLDHYIGTGGAEVLVWLFWATVCYTPFALFR